MDLPMSGAVGDVCFSMYSWECQKLLWATSALTSAFTAPGPDTAVTKTSHRVVQLWTQAVYIIASAKINN